MSRSKVFLSYRRDDSEGYAGRLYDRLASRFPDRIFRDVKDLEPGVDFVEEIERKLENCKLMITVIGPRWLAPAEATGRRRIDEPDDLHRQEIVTALRRKVRVIPALVGGARMPSAEQLPEDLAFLARRQAISITEPDFDHDVARLMDVLEKELGEAGQTGPVLDTRGATPAQALPPAPRPPRSGRLGWMIAGGVLAVVLLGIVGLLVEKGTSEPAQAPAPVQSQPAPAAALAEAPPPPERLSPAPVSAAPEERARPPLRTAATQSRAGPAEDPASTDPALPARTLDLVWRDGTADLVALVPRLSPSEQAELNLVAVVAQAQGGDVFAIHVRASNTGDAAIMVTPQQLTLHVQAMSTPLTPGQHPGFFRGGRLRPGQMIEGLLLYPAAHVVGAAIRSGAGELRFSDETVDANVERN